MKGGSMFTEKWLAIIGVFLLAVGMFLPVFHVNSDNTTINWIDVNPDNDISADGAGVYILILAAVTLLLLVMDRSEYTWATVLLAFLLLFFMFSSVWSLAINNNGSLRIGWSVILGGLILMSAPFWPESLKIYLGWSETEAESVTLKENSESVQEDEA
jgi:hypothetical protein